MEGIIVMDSLYIDLEEQKFINIEYHLMGYDPDLHKNRNHEGFEIIQTWSNEGYVLVKDRVYPMLEGAIYIINGIESHSTNPADIQRYTRSKITFSPSYLHKIIDLMGHPYLLDPFINNDNSNCMFVPPLDIRDEFDNIFDKITRESCANPAGASALISSCVVEMLTHIYRLGSLDDKSMVQHAFPHQNHISSMIEYINANLTKEFILDEMCDDLHLSKFYACHIFKKVTKMTIMEYLIERRISEAKKLLSHTNKPISDIAMSTGFSSFSLFSRTFSKLTGCTPLEYRKR